MYIYMPGEKLRSFAEVTTNPHSLSPAGLIKAMLWNTTYINYIMCQVILVFWLVLSYDLLEERCIGVVSNIFFWFVSLLCKTSKFHVAMHLFSNRSQKTLKCEMNNSTSHTHLMARFPLFCSYHILTSAAIYYWTDTWQHGIYLLIWQCQGVSECYLYICTVVFKNLCVQCFWDLE